MIEPERELKLDAGIGAANTDRSTQRQNNINKWLFGLACVSMSCGDMYKKIDLKEK